MVIGHVGNSLHGGACIERRRGASRSWQWLSSMSYRKSRYMLVLRGVGSFPWGMSAFRNLYRKGSRHSHGNHLGLNHVSSCWSSLRFCRRDVLMANLEVHCEQICRGNYLLTADLEVPCRFS